MVGRAVVGSTLQREGEEEEGEEDPSTVDTYEVMGTLTKPDATKPDAVTQIIPVRYNYCYIVVVY